MLVILQEKMGRSSSLAACEYILSENSCALYVCLGIAGGLSKDLSLGDVCYSGQIIDVYDNSKVLDIEGAMDIELSPEVYNTDRRITAALSFIRTNPDLRGLYDYWQEDQAIFAAKHVTSQVPGRFGPEEVGAPKCLPGPIVCGAVAQSEHYKKKLKGITRNILAIETESGPIFEYCDRNDISSLCIRGISDYADKEKSQLERTSMGGVRKLAARNAATFLHMQLQNYAFLRSITKAAGTELAPQLPLETSSTDLSTVIESLDADYDAKLRELSPQFRTKPHGYRLPTPRIRASAGTGMEGMSERPQAMELVAALSAHKRVIIHVPRMYPDPALAWIMASGLILTDLGDKKIIPLVIDGKSLGPPRGTISINSPTDLNNNIENKGGEIVFIIDSFPITSKTKRSFFLEDIKNHPERRFVFVFRGETPGPEYADFARAISAEVFDLCDVSFYEMATFLEKTFDMPCAEAEVVALKLRNTFRRFSLPAHPSFFAGIPQETLASLLSANRRSELIQLAIDGFLIFLVASDPDPVKLSRTKRADFLRELVVEINIEKRRFSEAELVEFAQKFSDVYDYGINTISFIDTYIKNGLIHFENGSAVVTLPFIEAFLLATHLKNHPEVAVRYFDVDSGDFDLLTFDLYCEVGPSDVVVDSLVGNLKDAINSASGRNEQHILLSGKLFPSMLRNPNRLNSLSTRVSEAREAVASGGSDKIDKIKILDIVDRVNEEVAVAADTKEEEQEAKALEEDNKPLTKLVSYWFSTTMLLGSGAESIKGDKRQELCSLILEGADRVLDEWISLFHSIDFNNLKTEIKSDVEFRASASPGTEKDFDSFVDAFVDFVEFTTLSEPLTRVFYHLLECARHRIIGQSISKATSKSVIGRLIQGIWMTDIDPPAGRGILSSPLSELPDARFLRAALTAFLVTRVKWNVSEQTVRLAHLDTADQLVRSTTGMPNKGELMRLVEKTPLDELLGDDD